MKAIIPAAGLGSRMKRSTGGRPKGMLDVGGRPLIEHAFLGAIEFDANEIVVVVAPGDTSFESTFGSCFRNIPLKYVEQQQRNGIAGALVSTLSLLGRQDAALLLADEILVSPRRRQMRAAFDEGKSAAVLGVFGPCDVGRISCDYDVRFGEGGRVVEVREKPHRPVGNLAGLGNCLFTRDFLELARSVTADDVRGECLLTGLIQLGIDLGLDVGTYNVCSEYVNVNTPSDLESARWLLSRCATLDGDVWSDALVGVSG